MTVDALKRKLTAIMVADVVGYSRLMGYDEVSTVQTLKLFKQTISTLIIQHRGRVVDSPGDNILSEFASVVDAVQSAVAIQKAIKTNNAKLADNRKMQFRIGINLGDVIEEDDRIYGDGVNITARLEALADPGGICISRTAYDQIVDKLPFGYEYLGEKAVRNIVKPIHAYRVVYEPKEQSAKVDNVENVNGSGINLSSEMSIIKSIVKLFTIKDRRSLRKHLLVYASVIGSLFIANIITWPGLFWFHWPALFWGLIIFIQWIVWIKDSDSMS